MPRHLLSLFDLKEDEIYELLERAKTLKQANKKGEKVHSLAGKSLAMVFEKNSTRTRVSFEIAMFELGGHALNLSSSGSQLGRGETYEDTARVLSRYVNGIMVRTFEQTKLERMAEAASVPIINGLTDLYHPCQVLADLMTAYEDKGNIKSLHISYIGDGNNLANTWITAAIILGFKLSIATPKGFFPSAMILDKVKKDGYSNIMVTEDPKLAVKDVDVINTDTWVSMGQEGKEEDNKKKVFKPYQVNAELLSYAKKDAIVMHCLPAHRGDEITDEVMDGPQSRIFDEAENRLHIQKAILEKFLTI
ncbi:MAG: ornithine carbamoyltransferase [Deltaproteobacteria bacterium CG07_land_8_20_14_0_80_38_7]|nr:MAG: ornithine carbamoyltransferase [Deltaproteobacteria bacterium CG07_land_8_20_14_0_80_38_7]